MLAKKFALIKCLIYLWPNVGDGDCGSERQKENCIQPRPKAQVYISHDIFLLQYSHKVPNKKRNSRNLKRHNHNPTVFKKT
nr:hypothetical protein CFP56_35380 [Quercus suber]